MRCKQYLGHSNMIKTTLTLLFSLSQISAGPSIKATNRDASEDKSFIKNLSNEPRSMVNISVEQTLKIKFPDPGEPLGPRDFFLASQLPKIPPNMTTDMMMKVCIKFGRLYSFMISFIDCRRWRTEGKCQQS